MIMGALEIIAFGLFAINLVGMYMSIRREIAPIGVTAAIGIVVSVITMILFMLPRSEMALQAVLLGMLTGASMAIITIGTAFYFHQKERKPHANDVAEHQ
jgi:uncharacterized membrane protein